MTARGSPRSPSRAGRSATSSTTRSSSSSSSAPRPVKRSAGNIKHIRPFTQLLWLAYFSKKLVEEKRTSTLRDVYYSAQAFDVEFQDQAESDELITDLEVLLGGAREEFNVYPGGEERDLREPDDRVHGAGLRGKETRPLGPPGRDDDRACHDDRRVRGHRRRDGPRHREGRALHEVHRGEGPREVQGDTHQHRRSAAEGHPVPAEEAPLGAEAPYRDTLRR